MSRFLQIHSLCSYPGALLNRDDAGFAKRIPFGDATRTRISSQCLKRHWRTFEGEDALSSLYGGGLQGSIRSRLSFDKFVLQPLLSEDKVEEPLARKVVEALMDEVLGKSEKAKKSDDAEAKKTKGKKGAEPTPEAPTEKKEEALQTNQVTVLGKVELEYLRKEAKKICDKKPGEKEISALIKESRKNFQALKKAASGLDAALFGRMVTGDVLARGDAAVHVAHAFTVHEEDTESDYFSAVDDLLPETGGQGSGHINSSELTSGLYYSYVVVDVPLLLSNLAGVEQPKEVGARVVEKLLHLIATVSPGAKLGSTAPYSYAQFMMVEAGKSQPRTLANAFLQSISKRPNLITNSYQALGAHLEDLAQMYGKKNEARAAGLGGSQLAPVLGALGVEKPISLDDLGKWAAQQVGA